MQLLQSSDWDMSEFELVNSWHYCKADLMIGVPMNLCEYVGKKRIHSKAKGFRFELYDVKMNPLIIECWFKNTTGKAKASGAKAMLKIYMRKDRDIPKKYRGKPKTFMQRGNAWRYGEGLKND